MSSQIDQPHPGAAAPALACILLTHRDPAHVHRLIDALDPFPVFLHCDRRTADPVFEQMTAGLPDRVTVLPRIATPWAGWMAVEAEIAGYRAALAQSSATHIATLSGSDYPLVSTERIAAYLDDHDGRSIVGFDPLPRAPWGRDGGLARLRYRHRPWRQHMIRIPLPRRIPSDVAPAGGSVHKVLARHHAQQLVDAFDSRPDLRAFWRHSWAPDETFIPTILNSPLFAPDWAESHAFSEDLWFIDWAGGGGKSPEWMRIDHLPKLTERAAAGSTLFARKFSSDRAPGLLDAIDAGPRSTARA
ncbi:hypothetical protein ABIB25_004718 [Nakamurella sp. UYEF19]|uniref:beta-1,6-N-acetylglucosaminyltransferase n=1 Tax=Nakamurella sp. UYEF19 TaxID=1756392 RepID=UPI00339B8D6B